MANKASTKQRWALASEITHHLPGIAVNQTFAKLTDLANDGQLVEGILENNPLSIKRAIEIIKPQKRPTKEQAGPQMGEADIEIDRRYRKIPECRNLSFLLKRGFRYQTTQGDYYLSGWHIREAIEMLAEELRAAQARINELERIVSNGSRTQAP